MKKLLIFLMLLASTISFIGFQSQAVTEWVQYDLTFTDNSEWDLDSGIIQANPYKMRTNRIILRDNVLRVSSLHFSHILFFDRNNVYMGYYNTPNSTYEGSKFLGNISSTTINTPINSSRFAIVAEKDGINRILTELDNQSVNDLIDTVLLSTLQLVTNGDFSNGTTGWIPLNTTLNVSDGIISATQTGSDAGGFSQPFTFTSGIKYYNATRIRVTNAISTSIRVLYLPSGSIIAQQNTPVENQWYFLSNVTIAGTSQTSLYIRQGYVSSGDALGKVVQSEYVYIFNISTLQTNKLYSPLFNTTFDLMSDANIKIQMDAFVASGLSTRLYEFNSIGVTITDFAFWVSQYEYLEQWTPITALNFYSVVAEYERDVINTTPPNLPNSLNNWIDGLGIGTLGKILISVVIIVALSILLGLLGASGVILFINVILWFVVFSVLGWYPLGMVITVSLILAILIFFNLRSGGSRA
jgi:hypothetical protein